VSAKRRRQIFFRSQPAFIQLHNRQPRASFIPRLPTHVWLTLHQHLGQPVVFHYLNGLGWLPSRKVEIIHLHGPFLGKFIPENGPAENRPEIILESASRKCLFLWGL